MIAQLYRSKFMAIAQNHLKILADTTNNRFLEIVEAYDPRTLDYTSEFKNSLTSKTKNIGDKYALCLVSLANGYDDNINQNKKLIGLGAFLVFKKQNLTDVDGLATVLDEAREIGEQIMAYLREEDYLYNNDNRNIEPLKIDWNEVQCFPFTHNTSNGLVGARFEFKTETQHNVKMQYNAAFWTTPLPERA